jgi:hypothetical protein
VQCCSKLSAQRDGSYINVLNQCIKLMYYFSARGVYKSMYQFGPRTIEGLCPENRRLTPFESASALKYLRPPTALRSKPAYRTPCSSKLSAQRGMNLLASPTLCGPRFWKNSNGSETKMKPNNKSLFDCSLMRFGGAKPKL